MTTSRPRIVIVGAAAAGTLTAVHLIRTAGRRATPLDLLLVDPCDRVGRGVAFGTTDDRHLLNVTAGGMSALPEDPRHFVAWRASQHLGGETAATDFAPRREYGRYLEETLAEACRLAPDIALRHVRARAVGVDWSGAGIRVRTEDGRFLEADAAVLATGLAAAGVGWAPADLVGSPFFVPDPWAPGALDVVRRDATGPADVLLVGTGLTMVDVALSLGAERLRPDRVVHAISRSGRLPRVHADTPGLAARGRADHR